MTDAFFAVSIAWLRNVPQHEMNMSGSSEALLGHQHKSLDHRIICPHGQIALPSP